MPLTLRLPLISTVPVVESMTRVLAASLTVPPRGWISRVSVLEVIVEV